MRDRPLRGRSRAAAARAAPFLVAGAGVAAITAAIGLARPWLDVPNATVAYLLLVLVLGARWGSPPAILAAALAFLAYDFFFVPPVGTLLVSAPREALNLVLLLAGALAGGQLAARLRLGRAQAETAAAQSGALYEVAIEALKASDVEAALTLVSKRGARLPSVRGLSLLAADGAELDLAAGPPVNEAEMTQARWSWEHQQPVGLRLSGDRLIRLRSFPKAPGGTAWLPLSSGLAVIRFSQISDGDELKLLAALLALAALLLDRRRAVGEGERLRELEASDSLKAAVLSSLSHELKSPLATLRAGLTALSMPEAGLGHEQRDLLLGLDRQASRLDRLVGDLLTMSRLEAGVGLDLQPRSYPELAGAVLQRLAGQLEPFKLDLDLRDDLPAVLVDELQVDRLLTNLLVNAAEWTSPGGTIGVGAGLRGSMLRAWVENEGPEIPPLDLRNIFHKFWTAREGGSGLGLAMSRQIVEAHGGTITVRNLRRGPRFTFTLPLAGEGNPGFR